ncbi:tol-pal system protein YbgF [Halorhodospira abdelmalekii]|uniref:tol-pal system protein YbgF n=1 Tax=Halorhodospira abdelmalekii TaxID=421629 RepID=UPI001904520B|nr:tol-pal system protein YbgF [Halorhodospira abdelmalekii]MBK1734655.1 tol-pal system protein YbgF [Halorhodospira abdelmalekii]
MTKSVHFFAAPFTRQITLRRAVIAAAGLVVLFAGFCPLPSGMPLVGVAAASEEEAGESASERHGLTALVRDLERIKQENRELRGELEGLEHQLRRLEQQQRSLYEDLDERIMELHAQDRPAASSPPEAEPPAGWRPADGPVPDLEGPMGAHVPGAASGDETNATEVDERSLYQGAFERLSDGDFGAAREGFARVVEHFPEGRYAPNALYWIAETYYAEREFSAARERFKQVVIDHPESEKAGDALLKLGYVAFEEGDYDEALERLEQVRAAYPESTAAELAQRRIGEIRRLSP